MAIVEKCRCARTVKSLIGRTYRDNVVGKKACTICKGVGMVVACAACGGAGLKAGSTTLKADLCAVCAGSGRVPFKAA